LEITPQLLGKAPLLHRKMVRLADGGDLFASPLRISDGAAVDPWGTSVIGSRTPRAFSSEVDTGSREENAPK
jgi:hypothetical protein